MSDDLLTVRQVAQRLGVTAETVRRWVRGRIMPALYLSERAIRIRPDELAAWLEAGRPADDGEAEGQP